MENASELRIKLKKLKNDFLSNPKSANNLLEIIEIFEECVKNSQPVSSCLLVLEEIFTRLLSTDTMTIRVEPLKPKDTSAATKYKEWLLQRYEDSWTLILESCKSEKNADSCQALVTAMKLLSLEGRHPFEQNTEDYFFPINRFKSILIALLSPDKQNSHLFQRFKEFTEYLDVVYYTWKQLPLLTKTTANNNTIFALNYLDLIDAIPMTKDIQENRKLFCARQDGAKPHESFDYVHTRKSINKVWNCVMLWEMKEPIHKKVLIVLLERVLPHLEKPIQLTDFLMDSLDFGGPIGLLALQGVFTLIQKHNITYPNVYEKLYSMFEPEIFHTKFKARLFYLADIFLSSTHLPENLVAAFVKRLARLSLVAPPQDAVIILYFIGNMILRHPSLKRLIAAQQAIECSQDPFVMEEREPSKSNAIESSLWEIVALQNHAVPSVAVAAKFISQPMPKHEWDLSTVLDLKDDDIFDQEISRKSKQYALIFDRPQSMFLNRNDKVVQYWKLF